MPEAGKPNYLDVVRAEFVELAGNKGVETMIAQELSEYLTEKMMSSWRNGMRIGMQKRGAPQAAAV